MKIKIFETTTYAFFSAEIHLAISECEATKCKPCSPPSVPMQFHDKSMLFTIVLTFNASARACETKDVKPCQNHVKPESLQCDLRQYIATGGCNHGKPTKIHEPNHTLRTNRRLFGSFRKFYSFMMFYGSQILKKKRIFHILQSVGGFNKTEKYAYQIGSFPQVGIKTKDR